MKTTPLQPDPAKMLNFIDVKHRTQVRKYTGEPYTKHLREVSGIIVPFHSQFKRLTLAEAICVSLGHDLIEDTDATKDEIQYEFGAIVAEGIYQLSDPPEGNRDARIEGALIKIGQAWEDVQSIKCGDSISNTSSIIAHDLDFARAYLPEKRRTLEACTQAAPGLLAYAFEILKKAEVDLALVPSKPAAYNLVFKDKRMRDTVITFVPMIKSDHRAMRHLSKMLKAFPYGVSPSLLNRPMEIIPLAKLPGTNWQAGRPALLQTLASHGLVLNPNLLEL